MRLLTCLLLLHSIAVADEPSPEPSPDELIAKGHYKRGVALYDAGNFAEAVKEFEAARAAKPLSAFDYNIARARARLGDAAGAIAAYERYLAAEPRAFDTDEIHARIALLRAKLTPPPSPPPPRPAPIELTERRPFRRDRLKVSLAVGVVGCGLLVGALVAELISQSRLSQLQQRCAADGSCDPLAFPDAQSTIDSGRSTAIAADVLLTVGLVAIATGVVLALTARAPRPLALRSGFGAVWTF